MGIIIYCLPALGWGLMPVISKKAGGSPEQQIMGTTIAALIFALTIQLLVNVTYTSVGIVAGMVSGIFWAGGQFLQFKALTYGDVSNVMPLSNGSQLIFTTVASGIILGEWQSLKQVIITLAMMGIIIFAISLLSQKSGNSDKGISGKVILLICGSSLCLLGYVITTSILKVSGLQIFLPQSFAMVICSLILSKSSQEAVTLRPVVRNLFTGSSWAMANMALFYASSKLGLGLSYTISQLCIFISIIAGIVILKEQKSKSELYKTGLGTILFFAVIMGLSQFK